MKTAIAFITLIPNKQLINFCNNILKDTFYDIFIFIDDNNYKPPKDEVRLKFIQINNEECIKCGFQWVTYLMYNSNSLQV